MSSFVHEKGLQGLCNVGVGSGAGVSVFSKLGRVAGVLTFSKLGLVC